MRSTSSNTEPNQQVKPNQQGKRRITTTSKNPTNRVSAALQRCDDKEHLTAFESKVDPVDRGTYL